MSWLEKWLSNGISFSMLFSYPDASRDVCAICGTVRRFHKLVTNENHHFKENHEQD